MMLAAPVPAPAPAAESPSGARGVATTSSPREWPSWPNSLPPHESATPCAVTTTVWNRPHAAATTRVDGPSSA